jgi:hypothetical protein
MFKKTLLVTTAALFATSTFAADVDNTNLDIAFQGAHFQGAGNQITMLRVPVTNKDSGETQFFDMSAEFAADKNGNLIFKNISSVQSVAFASANQLVAGHYLDQNNRSWWVDGPSVATDGRMIWSISTRIGANGSSGGGQVMSGPAKGNELIVNKNNFEKIIKSAASLNYGVMNDVIISASQAGNMITLVDYYKGIADDSWSLRLSPEPQPED